MSTAAPAVKENHPPDCHRTPPKLELIAPPMKLLVTKAVLSRLRAFTSTANSRIWLSTLTAWMATWSNTVAKSRMMIEVEPRLAMMSEMRASASATTLAARTVRSPATARRVGQPRHRRDALLREKRLGSRKAPRSFVGADKIIPIAVLLSPAVTPCGCALLTIGRKTLDDVVGHGNQEDSNDRRGQHSADYRRGHDSSGDSA